MKEAVMIVVIPPGPDHDNGYKQTHQFLINQWTVWNPSKLYEHSLNTCTNGKVFEIPVDNLFPSEKKIICLVQ